MSFHIPQDPIMIDDTPDDIVEDAIIIAPTSEPQIQRSSIENKSLVSSNVITGPLKTKNDDAPINAVEITQTIKAKVTENGKRPLIKKAFGEAQSNTSQSYHLIDDSDDDNIAEISSGGSRTTNRFQSEASHPFSIA